MTISHQAYYEKCEKTTTHDSGHDDSRSQDEKYSENDLSGTEVTERLNGEYPFTSTCRRLKLQYKNGAKI